MNRWAYTRCLIHSSIFIWFVYDSSGFERSQIDVCKTYVFSSWKWKQTSHCLWNPSSIMGRYECETMCPNLLSRLWIFAWADVVRMVLLLHTFLVFTCWDPFWLVFETLHLSFRFVSFAMPSFHIIFICIVLLDKRNTWLKSFASLLSYSFSSRFSPRLCASPYKIFLPCNRLFNSIRCQSKYFSKLWMCCSPSSWLNFQIDVAYLTSES